MKEGRRAGGASDGGRERVLGQEHPDKLTSMTNLAFTWKSQSRNNEAIEFDEKSVSS